MTSCPMVNIVANVVLFLDYPKFGTRRFFYFINLLGRVDVFINFSIVQVHCIFC